MASEVGVGIGLLESAGPDVLIVADGTAQHDAAFLGIPVADQVAAFADGDGEPTMAGAPGIEVAVPGELPVAEEIADGALRRSEEVA